MADIPPAVTELLNEIVSTRARSHPDRLAFVFLENGERETQSLTYDAFHRAVCSVAIEVRRRVSPGSRAILLYTPGLEFFVAFQACLFAGVIAVPLYPPVLSSPPQWAAFFAGIANDCEASLVLTEGKVVPSFLRLTQKLKPLDVLNTEEVSRESATQALEPRAGTETAFLQYTSGTTGDPKGVMVSHQNLAHNISMIRHFFGYEEGERLVSWLPQQHDMGLVGTLSTLSVGGTLWLMPPMAFIQRPARWLRAISRYRANTTAAPNFAYEHCLVRIRPEECVDLDLSSWRTACNGAEPVRARTVAAFSEAFEKYGFSPSTMKPVYGLAEGTLIVSGASEKRSPVVVQLSAEEDSMLSVGLGHPALGQEVVIVDPEKMTPVPDGEIGEIWVAGKSVAQGYWGRTALTTETFQAQLADGRGPFLRTGDFGSIKGGELFCRGRLKDLIICNGRNFFPADIEATAAVALQTEPLASLSAFGLDTGEKEEVVLVVEVRQAIDTPRANELGSSIRSAIFSELGCSVNRVVFVRSGEIPKTASGKVRRLLCRSQFVAGTLPIGHVV